MHRYWNQQTNVLITLIYIDDKSRWSMKNLLYIKRGITNSLKAFLAWSYVLLRYDRLQRRGITMTYCDAAYRVNMGAGYLWSSVEGNKDMWQMNLLLVLLSSLDDRYKFEVVDLAALYRNLLPYLLDLIFGVLVTDVQKEILEVFLVQLARLAVIE